MRFETGSSIRCVNPNGQLTMGKIYVSGGCHVKEDGSELVWVCLDGGDMCEKNVIRFVLEKNQPNTKKGTEMDNNLFKDYFKKHKDTLMTVSIVVLLDEFLLGGGLRDKVKSMLSGILDGMEKRIKGISGDEDEK